MFRWEHRLQRQKNLFMAFNRVIFTDDGSNIGSTVDCRGEPHRHTLHLTCRISLHARRDVKQNNKDKRRDEPAWSQLNFVSLGVGLDGCLHYYCYITLKYNIISHRGSYYCSLTRQETRFCFLIIIRWIY